jgi:multicomponent Na+:H+ antiporter subunit B
MALRLNHLFAVIMLSGAFSLVSAMLFVVMDAVDVAFTEAAVGAGISTVLMLSTMALTARVQKKTTKTSIFPLVIVLLVGVLLIYGTLDMPNFGAWDSAAQLHLGNKYLEITSQDIGIPNVVTAILASYRGYDTLGETVVVLTAGLGVILLLSSLKNRKE